MNVTVLILVVVGALLLLFLVGKFIRGCLFRILALAALVVLAYLASNYFVK